VVRPLSAARARAPQSIIASSIAALLFMPSWIFLRAPGEISIRTAIRAAHAHRNCSLELLCGGIWVVYLGHLGTALTSLCRVTGGDCPVPRSYFLTERLKNSHTSTGGNEHRMVRNIGNRVSPQFAFPRSTVWNTREAAFDARPQRGDHHLDQGRRDSDPAARHVDISLTNSWESHNLTVTGKQTTVLKP